MLDERQDVLFDTKVNTSRFGIASADWPIPQNANSGHYTIEVGPDGLDSTFSHDVEIRRYEPWSKPERAKTLDFAVNCTPSTLAINQVSECDVSAGRSSFRGYGMLIANVGLPPGAEVDRGSLAALVEKRAIDSFEIAPDHVGIYLWPQAAGPISNSDSDRGLRCMLKGHNPCSTTITTQMRGLCFSR